MVYYLHYCLILVYNSIFITIIIFIAVVVVVVVVDIQMNMEENTIQNNDRFECRCTPNIEYCKKTSDKGPDYSVAMYQNH